MGVMMAQNIVYDAIYSMERNLGCKPALLAKSGAQTSWKKFQGLSVCLCRYPHRYIQELSQVVVTT